MNAAIRDPLNGMWLVTIIAGFIFFTDTHVRSWRILGGAFHALLHLAAAFLVGWLALLLTVSGFDLHYGSIAQLLLSGLITVPAGRRRRVVHPRRLSIRVDPHLRPPLRTRRSRRCASRTSSNGCGCASMRRAALTIFAIAIDRVPRRWRATQRGGEATFEANDARATRAATHRQG